VCRKRKWGLNVDSMKTRMMPVTKKNGPCQQAFSKGNEVEIVHNFMCLGSNIDANGACGNESRRRVAVTGAAVNRLCNQSSKDRISLFLMLRLLEACVAYNVCNNLYYKIMDIDNKLEESWKLPYDDCLIRSSVVRSNTNMHCATFN